MMKIVFILGVIFCFLQIVCSFPAALEQKSENDSSEEVGDPEDMLANFIFGTLMTCEVLASTFLTHCNNIFPPTDLAMDKRNHAISKSLIEVSVFGSKVTLKESLAFKGVRKFKNSKFNICGT